jgi:hypothetical protein
MFSVYVAQHNSPIYYYIREESAQVSDVNRATSRGHEMLIIVPWFLLEGVLKVNVQVMLGRGGYAVGR